MRPAQGLAALAQRSAEGSLSRNVIQPSAGGPGITCECINVNPAGQGPSPKQTKEEEKSKLGGEPKPNERRREKPGGRPSCGRGIILSGSVV